MSHPLGTKTGPFQVLGLGRRGGGRRGGRDKLRGEGVGVGKCFCCKHTWRGLRSACEDVAIMLVAPKVLEGPVLKVSLRVLFSVIRVQCRHAWEEGPRDGPIGGERCNGTQNSAGGLPRLLEGLL